MLNYNKLQDETEIIIIAKLYNWLNHDAVYNVHA